jgi:hypothetical protein
MDTALWELELGSHMPSSVLVVDFEVRSDVILRLYAFQYSRKCRGYNVFALVLLTGRRRLRLPTIGVRGIKGSR